MKTLEAVFQKPLFPKYDLAYRFPGNENGNTTGQDEDPEADDKPGKPPHGNG